jgi:hypothetical protein
MLEVMSRLVAERRFEEFDCEHLSEYLSDMARRDRREVYSRLGLADPLTQVGVPAIEAVRFLRGTILTQRASCACC